MSVIIGSTSRPYNSLSYEEAYARIGAAGYEDVAVFANEGKIPIRADSSASEVAGVRRAAAAAGVRPSMVLGRTKLDEGVEKGLEDYRRLIDNAAAVEASWLLDLGTGKEEHYSVYFELMQRVAPLAAAAGLAITMKPHGGISLTTEHLLAACTKVDHPAFRICCDPGNIIYYTKGAQRPETDIDQVAPVVSTAIIKDCVVVDGQPDVMVTAGDGLVDFGRILGGLQGGGFDGPFYVECVGASAPEQVDRDLTFTLGYVRGIMAAL